jgi:small subunit ribosomal protein S1
VHISELAQHHVENPREVVSQGDEVDVLILEVDAERRRLSLSLKRVEDDQRTRSGDEEYSAPNLDLSEDVFTDDATPPTDLGGTDSEPSFPAAAEEDVPDAAAERESVESAVAAETSEPAAADESRAAAAPADEH